jgi:hypothetical protein
VTTNALALGALGDATRRSIFEHLSERPPEHHISETPLAEMVFEPRQGGHVYDRGTDGSE